jgi:hypothetical protein
MHGYFLQKNVRATNIILYRSKITLRKNFAGHSIEILDFLEEILEDAC